MHGYYRLVVQLGQHSHTSLYPVLLFVLSLHRKADKHHKVCGMPSRREHTLSERRLVDRTLVYMTCSPRYVVLNRFNIPDRLRQQPNMRNWCIQHFRLALLKSMDVVVPIATFKEKPMNVCPILRLLIDLSALLKRKNRHVEGYLVDWYLVFTRKILFRASNESLSKKEPAYPVLVWSLARIKPVLQ